MPVGTIGASANVSNGTASYTLPIILPQGTNGVVPPITINYNSQGQNGPLGYGWSLAASSLISRVPRTIYHDGAVNPVEINGNDRFALDGQRLIATNGTYGNHNTTYGKESEDFSVITSLDYSNNGQKYFICETKDGVIYEYGNSTDSRYTNSNIRGTVITTLYWRLNKVRYKDGNYIEYKYVTLNNEMLLDEINYTGNSITGLLPYNNIKFNYFSRIDVNTTYEAGYPISSYYLLDNIQITTENYTTFKTYQFIYGLGNDFVTMMLKSIEEKGSNGIALNPTIFKYGEIPSDFEFGTSNLPDGEEANTDLFSGDYDGDGSSDLLKAYYTKTTNNGIEYKIHTGFKIYKRYSPINQAYATFTVVYSETFPAGSSFQLISNGQSKYQVPNIYYSSDFNGDGKDDIIFHKLTATSVYPKIEYFKLYTSSSITGSNTFSFITTQIPPPSNNQTCGLTIFDRFNVTNNEGNGQYFYPGDYDGDGATDFITMTSNGSGYKAMISFPLLGSYYNEIENTYTIDINNCRYANTFWGKVIGNVIDFDGDGKSDIMLTRNGTSKIFSIEKNGQWQAKQLYTGSFPDSTNMLFFGDFNGDRKTDILYRLNGDDILSQWSKAINTGTSFIQSTYNGFNKIPIIYAGNTSKYGDDKLFIVDINGDGKSDIFHGWNNYINGVATTSKHDVYYSSANTFRLNSTSFNSIYGKESQNVTDINGDGRADFINRLNVGSAFINYYFKKEGKEFLLEKVKNGIDHDIEFSYKRMTESSNFYTKGTTSVYPLNDFQAPIYLVSKFISENGIGGFNQIDYKYEEAMTHKQGKGLLGFRKLISIDGTLGYTSINSSAINSTFFINFPSSSTRYLTSTNTLLYLQLNQYTVENLGSKRFQLKMDSNTEYKYFEGQTIISNFIYDLYGNILQSNNNNGVELKSISNFYGQFGTPIPSKLTSMTESVIRTGQATYSTTSTYGYNALGQLTSKVDFSGLPKSITTTYGYDLFGNQNSTTVTPSSMAARTMSIQYDTKGRFPISIKNVLNQTSTVLMDTRWGQPISTTDIDGLTKTFTYDNFGRVLTTTLPQGYIISNTYGWDINATEGTIHYVKTSHPGKPDEKKWFDVLDRIVKKEIENFANTISIQKTTYDARGNLFTSTLPYKQGETILTTTNLYDVYNRPISATNIIGQTTYSYAYTSGNLKTTVVNPALQEKSSITDASGKMISATDYGGTLSYTYYSHGKMKEVKNGTTLLTLSEYDAYARQTKLTDINAGVTQYATDALGQITSTISATNQTTSFTYDIMGRKISHVRPEGNTTYQYYGIGNGASTNKIYTISNYGNIDKYYYYDAFGRSKDTYNAIDGQYYINSYTYNIYDDLITHTDPSGLVINYTYDANGFLKTIKNNTTTLYTQNNTNGLGQNTSYTLGSGNTSTTGYYFGTAYNFTTPGIQNLTLGWNYQSGNLNSRNDAIKGKTENFTYDNLNRLTSAKVVGQNTMNFNFAPNGNIANKTDVGVYVYGGPKINAVTEVTNTPGVLNTITQNIVYTSFYQPLTISENNNLLSFTYDDEDQRIKTVAKLNNVLVNTRYFVGAYEKNIANGVSTHLHYINSGDKLIAIIESNGSTINYHYTYTDHLGSILTATNSAGTIEAEQNFDAWGRNRNKTDWTYAGISSNPSWMYRGFTGHEHLPVFALINMNGRLYDPILGRMLSPDNNIQLLDYTQNYNRYSYAMNNPLKFTDPDGEFLFIPILIGALVGAATYTAVHLITHGNFNNWSWGGFAGAIVGGGIGGLVAPALAASGVGGFAGGAITGGASAVASTITTGIWNGDKFGKIIVNSYESLIMGALIGGVVGGTIAKIQGKTFLNGSSSKVEIQHGWADMPEYVNENGVKIPAHRLYADGTFSISDWEGYPLDGTKLLNQFNSAESLIQGAGNLSKVKAGMQGFVKGDGASIFKAITNGSIETTSRGGLIMNNGTIISKYFSSTSGDFTIFINQGSNAYKIRITP